MKEATGSKATYFICASMIAIAFILCTIFIINRNNEEKIISEEETTLSTDADNISLGDYRFLYSNSFDALDFTEKVKKSKQPLLLYNLGSPIENSITKENEKETSLFAVYGFVDQQGREREVYLYSNEDSMKLDETIDGIKFQLAKYKSTEMKHVSSKAIGYNYQIRHFGYKFRYTSKTPKIFFTVNYEFMRRNKKVLINGIRGSVWDIKATSSTETDTNSRFKNTRIEYVKIKMNANYSGQNLITYGPRESNVKGTIGVSLSSINTPTFSYSFSVKKFTLTDKSSKRKNYGAWEVEDKQWLLPKIQKKANLDPTIRVSNTKGALYVYTSASIYQQANNAWGKKFTIPGVKLAIRDRSK